MIVRDRPSILSLFFVMRGSIVPQIAPQIVAIFALGAAVTALHARYPEHFLTFSAAPFGLIGLALSIFLGFRNNACYDRWWEARKQWGQLVIDTRSLAREAGTLLDTSGEAGRAAQDRMTRLTVAFTHALRHHLRGSDPWAEIAPFLDRDDVPALRASRNLPDAILRRLGGELGDSLRRGLTTDILGRVLEERITALAGVQGACERILNTPLPFAYTLLLHRTAYMYCLLLPFGLVDTVGLLTPFVAAIVAYTFFGLDALSEELENPFGTSQHDLALKTMSRTIEINLREALGEEDLPDPVRPAGYYLP